MAKYFPKRIGLSFCIATTVYHLGDCAWELKDIIVYSQIFHNKEDCQKECDRRNNNES